MTIAAADPGWQPSLPRALRIPRKSSSCSEHGSRVVQSLAGVNDNTRILHTSKDRLTVRRPWFRHGPKRQSACVPLLTRVSVLSATVLLLQRRRDPPEMGIARIATCKLRVQWSKLATFHNMPWHKVLHIFALADYLGTLPRCFSGIALLSPTAGWPQANTAGVSRGTF